MSRQGADPILFASLLERFHRDSPLRLEGVMTHLFAADEADGKTHRQSTGTNGRGSKPDPHGRHSRRRAQRRQHGGAACRSGRQDLRACRPSWNESPDPPGPCTLRTCPRVRSSISRAAEPISLGEARRDLRPVLSWKSRVVSVRSVAPGAVVGYNGTFVATEPMRLALVAAGYADGLDRKLGNHFSLLVRGQRAPLVGRISMDQSVIDVTDIPGRRSRRRSRDPRPTGRRIDLCLRSRESRRHHPMGDLHAHRRARSPDCNLRVQFSRARR